MSTHHNSTITTEQEAVNFSMIKTDASIARTITNLVTLLTEVVQWETSDTINLLKTDFPNVTDWSI